MTSCSHESVNQVESIFHGNTMLNSQESAQNEVKILVIEHGKKVGNHCVGERPLWGCWRWLPRNYSALQYADATIYEPWAICEMHHNSVALYVPSENEFGDRNSLHYYLKYNGSFDIERDVLIVDSVALQDYTDLLAIKIEHEYVRMCLLDDDTFEIILDYEDIPYSFISSSYQATINYLDSIRIRAGFNDQREVINAWKCHLTDIMNNMGEDTIISPLIETYTYMILHEQYTDSLSVFLQNYNIPSHAQLLYLVANNVDNTPFISLVDSVYSNSSYHNRQVAHALHLLIPEIENYCEKIDDYNKSLYKAELGGLMAYLLDNSQLYVGICAALITYITIAFDE